MIEPEDNNKEIEWRKLLILKLESPKRILAKAAKEARAMYEAEKAAPSGYGSLEELREAYENDTIDIEEYDRAAGILDGSADEDFMLCEEAALDELNALVSRLKSEIRSLEWEAISQEERAAIEKRTAKYREQIRAAKEGKEFTE